METQTYEQAQTQPTSGWKTSVLYAILAAIFLVALVAYAYSNGYLKQVSGKANDFIASNLPAATATTHAANTEDGLSTARTAFAEGNVNAAIEGYRAIIAKTPDDIAARGELGNVLYSAGMFAEAAQTYYEVANMAIEKNQIEVAEALLPAVSEGNPMLANQLDDKLYQVQMRTDMAPPAPMQAPQQKS